MWTVNGVNPNTYGLKVSGVPGWETAPALDYSTQAVPGRAGLISLRPTPQVGPRRMQVEAIVSGSSNADLLTKLDQLKGLFSAPALVVVMDNRPTRQITCRLDGPIAVDPGEASMIQRKLPVTFTLVADDPWWYDIAGQNINFVAGSTLMPTGTAPSWPVITATMNAGAASLSVAMLHGVGAAQQGSITITHGLVNTDVVVIDTANKTLKINGVNQLSKITAGDFFSLDVERYGDYLTNAFPLLRLDTGSVASIFAAYKKAWR